MRTWRKFPLSGSCRMLKIVFFFDSETHSSSSYVSKTLNFIIDLYIFTWNYSSDLHAYDSVSRSSRTQHAPQQCSWNSSHTLTKNEIGNTTPWGRRNESWKFHVEGKKNITHKITPNCTKRRKSRTSSKCKFDTFSSVVVRELFNEEFFDRREKLLKKAETTFVCCQRHEYLCWFICTEATKKLHEAQTLELSALFTAQMDTLLGSRVATVTIQRTKFEWDFMLEAKLTRSSSGNVKNESNLLNILRQNCFHHYSCSRSLLPPAYFWQSLIQRRHGGCDGGFFKRMWKLNLSLTSSVLVREWKVL